MEFLIQNDSLDLICELLIIILINLAPGRVKMVSPVKIFDNDIHGGIMDEF